MLKQVGLCAVALAVIGATGAQAQQTLRSASGFGPAHIQATHVYPTFAEKLEELTEGRYRVQDFPSGLTSLPEMVSGLRDGVVDFGTVILTYFPSDFRETLVPGELSMIGSSHVIIASATTEYIATCAECRREFAGQGQVYIGSDSSPPFQIIARRPVENLSDFNGLRIRTAGAVYSAWAEFMGAEAVQIPASEIFEALSQGTVGAHFGSLPDLTNQQLYDIITNITLTNFGVFNSAAAPGMRTATWQSMSAEDRRAVIEAAQYAQVEAVLTWTEWAETAHRRAEESGIAVIKPSESIRGRMDDFVAAHLEQLTDVLAERGIGDAEDKISRYLALVEKWEGIVEAAEGDKDAIVAARMAEIWDNVDLSTYGL